MAASRLSRPKSCLSGLSEDSALGTYQRACPLSGREFAIRYDQDEGSKAAAPHLSGNPKTGSRVAALFDMVDSPKILNQRPSEQIALKIFGSCSDFFRRL